MNTESVRTRLEQRRLAARTLADECKGSSPASLSSIRNPLWRRAGALIAATTLLCFGLAAQAVAATRNVPGTYPTIQAAVTAAAPGDTIELADGSYSGVGYWGVYVNKPITIRSANGPGACVLDYSSATGPGLQMMLGALPGMVQIEGLTFRGSYYPALAGFQSTVNATFRIVNCVFENFQSSNQTAVVYDVASGPGTGRTELLGCTFRNNSRRAVLAIGSSLVRDCNFLNNTHVGTYSEAAAGCYLYSSFSTDSVTVERCRFADNRTVSLTPGYVGYGAALYLYAYSMEVNQNEFVRNNADLGGAAWLFKIPGVGNARVSSCSFVENRAVSYYGAAYADRIQFDNCLFAGNSANGIGAVSAYSSDFLNCTFARNYAAQYSRAVYNPRNIENCIFWDNTGPTGVPQIANAASLTHSLVQGGYAGVGNISADPLFVDAANGDFQLLFTSPARDAGVTYAGLAATDLAGNPRLVGTAPDMGCYEFQGTNRLPSVTCSGSTFELECQCGPSCTEVSVPFEYADADGDALTAHWTINGGSEFTASVAGGGPPTAGTFTVATHLGMGTHTIEFWVSDGEGESNRCSVTVRITDTTAASLVVPTETLYLECHVDAFDPLAGVSANDACAGDLTSSIIVDNTVDTLVPGIYVVNYSVTDPSGNATTATRTVVVRDTTPPEITMVGESFMTLYCGTGWNDPGASALDLCDGTVDVTATSDVNPNMIGTYTVTYTATDAAGNSTTVCRFVRMIAGIVGFSSPMAAMVPQGSDDPPLPQHAFKLGRTIPLKLQMLCGIAPLGASQVAPPQTVELARVGEAEDMSVVDINSGASNDNGPNFRWSDPQWVYNLSTANLTVGTYHIKVRMPDGQVFVGAFVLK